MAKGKNAAKPKQPKMIKHIVTQEDLDNNPEWVDQGLSIGDEVEYPESEEKDEDMSVEDAQAIVQKYEGINGIDIPELKAAKAVIKASK